MSHNRRSRKLRAAKVAAIEVHLLQDAAVIVSASLFIWHIWGWDGLALAYVGAFVAPQVVVRDVASKLNKRKGQRNDRY